MQVYTELLPETKSSRRSAINWTPSADEFAPVAGELVIHTDRASATYRVTEFTTGWDGRGFVLVKLAGGTDPAEEAYSVFCGRNRQDVECSCKGFARHGHCKHIDSCLALITNGWL